MSTELGKPLRWPRSVRCQELRHSYAIRLVEIPVCYGDRGPGFASSRPLSTDAGDAVLVSEPLGVLLGVEPWNWRWSSSRLRKHRAGRDGFHIKIEELLHDDRALVITQIRDRAG